MYPRVHSITAVAKTWKHNRSIDEQAKKMWSVCVCVCMYTHRQQITYKDLQYSIGNSTQHCNCLYRKLSEEE